MTDPGQGEPGRRDRPVYSTGVAIGNTTTGGQHGIRASLADDLVVRGSSVTGPASNGIYVIDTTGVLVDDKRGAQRRRARHLPRAHRRGIAVRNNPVAGCGEWGIQLNSATGAVALANEVAFNTVVGNGVSGVVHRRRHPLPERARPDPRQRRREQRLEGRQGRQGGLDPPQRRRRQRDPHETRAATPDLRGEPRRPAVRRRERGRPMPAVRRGPVIDKGLGSSRFAISPARRAPTAFPTRASPTWAATSAPPRRDGRLRALTRRRRRHPDQRRRRVRRRHRSPSSTARPATTGAPGAGAESGDAVALMIQKAATRSCSARGRGWSRTAPAR